MRSAALIATLLLTHCAWAQEPLAQHVIPVAADLFTTDDLGNVYVLHGDVLELYDQHGKRGLANSTKTFGRIASIDAFYSLKPMVFSREQGVLALLDNTLSLQGSIIELPRQGYPQVTVVCMSVQNSFWFFDERELALIRTDRQLRQLANTGRLDQLLGLTPKPNAMQEHDSRLYVNDPQNGILVFDLFGTYMKTIPIKNAESFEVRGRALFFFAGGRLQLYDMRSFEVLDAPLPFVPEGTVLDARVERGHIYLRLQDRIIIQELAQP
jgi:hypothetical protein